MRILSLTAGAASMYCGSCLRDNALATELIAPRPRRHAAAGLHADADRRAERQRRPRVLRRHQRLSAAALRRSSATRRAARRLWDSARVHPPRSKRVDPGRTARFLGGMTVSMLKGEDGHQRKELDKLIDWLKTQPAPDVVNLPFALLIGLARPIREALGAQIVCTLQGEDLFLEQLVEPWKSEAQAADPRAGRRGRSLHRRSATTTARFTADYLGVPLSEAAHRAARRQLQGLRLPDAVRAAPRAARAEPAVARAEARAVHDRLLRAHRAGEGARPARRGLRAAAHATAACRRRGSKRPAGWAPTRSRISRRCRRGCARPASLDEFDYRGELDRLEKVRFLPASTSSRCRRPTTSRRASRSSRRWRRRAGGAARARRVSRDGARRPAAACSSSRTTPTRSPRASGSCSRIGGGASALGRHGAGEVRAKYSVQAARPERLEAVLARSRRAAAKAERSRRVLRVEHLSKSFDGPPSANGQPPAQLDVLRDVSLSLAPGDSASIVGASGSGKSTLLYICGGLDPPTSGTRHARRHRSAHARRQGARRVPQPPRRLRLPGSLPAAAVLGARERADADAWSPAPPSDDIDRARTLLDRVGLVDAARSSAGGAVGRREAARRDRPRAGARSRRCCCATSRPATSIARPPRASPRCCSSCTRSCRRSWSSSPTTPSWLRDAAGSSGWSTGSWRDAVTPTALALRSLRYYWRTNLAVVAGVAVAVSVLAGALVVGASVKASLRELAVSRLGNADHARRLDGLLPRGARAELRSRERRRRLADAAGVHRRRWPGRRRHQHAARRQRRDLRRRRRVLRVPRRAGSGRRRRRVRRTPGAGQPGAGARARRRRRRQHPGAAAEPVDRAVGDAARPPRRARQDDARDRARACCRSPRLGEFSLRPQQGEVRAIFLPLARVQRELERPDRVNALSSPAGRRRRRARRRRSTRRASKRALTLADAGLSLRAAGGGAHLARERQRHHRARKPPPRRGGRVARARAGRRRCSPTSRTRIRIGTREVPYAVVAGVELDGARSRAAPAAAVRSGDDQIWLNAWAADGPRRQGRRQRDARLRRVGRRRRRWPRATPTFTVAGILPMTGLGADPTLTPDFPGISRSHHRRRLGSAVPGRPEAHHAARRGLLEATTGPRRRRSCPTRPRDRLWASRFGRMTSLRILPMPPAPATSATLAQAHRRALNGR